MWWSASARALELTVRDADRDAGVPALIEIMDDEHVLLREVSVRSDRGRQYRSRRPDELRPYDCGEQDPK